MFNWTQKAIETLKQRRIEGKSYGVIAAELGCSKGAAIGKATRMGFAHLVPAKAAQQKTRPPATARRQASFKGEASPKAEASSKGEASCKREAFTNVKPLKQNLHAGNIASKREARRRDPGLENVLTLALAPAPVTGDTVAFEDLQHGQCRFPVNAEEPSPKMMCCGAPVVNRHAREGKLEKTHCDHHRRVAAPDRRQPAGKAKAFVFMGHVR